MPTSTPRDTNAAEVGEPGPVTHAHARLLAHVATTCFLICAGAAAFGIYDLATDNGAGALGWLLAALSSAAGMCLACGTHLLLHHRHLRRHQAK